MGEKIIYFLCIINQQLVKNINERFIVNKYQKINKF